MKKTMLFIFSSLCLALGVAPALAAPDVYSGDSAIYGTPSALQANVLIIIDDSGSMGDDIPGTSYSSTVFPVTNSCGSAGTACNLPNAVYQYANNVYTLLNSDVANINTSCNKLNPQTLLQTTGQYNGRVLNANGSCGGKNAGSGSYVTGNYINWLRNPDEQPRPKIDIAKEVVRNIISSTSGVKFGLMTFNYEYGSADGHASSISNPNGGRFVSTTVAGGGSAKYVTTIKKMDDIFTGSITNRAALLDAIGSLAPTGNTPMGSVLYEAGRYFAGQAPAFGSTIGVAGGSYATPMEASCQKNYVVFVTDGMANSDDQSVLGTICTDSHGHATGDCDGDGKEPDSGSTTKFNHSLDDVAKYLNAGPQNITTFTIGYGLSASDPAVSLLQRAADDSHGKGNYYPATNQMDLSAAFSKVLAQIFSVNSSYVAPVVPVSPENRTYGGSRIFMGFFKPVNGSYWFGNLKKFGLDAKNQIVDADGALATYVDTNNDGNDDNSPYAHLPLGAVNGSFKPGSKSYWSTAVDGGDVPKGGSGALLQAMANITTTRKIYTVNSSGSLIPFTTVTPAMLGYDSADTTSRNNLVSFIFGQDPYDENMNGDLTANRGWIMGDVLHSRPMVINYASYAFNTTNEPNCSVNKTMMFVGANDGMLHAIKDCDGSEAWAFIPPDMLPNLQFINSGNHVYFADSTAAAYIYDANNNGNIESGDKVVLVFGSRRGGGGTVAPTTGAYYALDVTAATAAPTLLWQISNNSPVSGPLALPVYPELAETWSEPKLLKMKIGSATKIVAVLGAGYDNPNEDQRYGATQTFPTTSLNVTDTGTGAMTSGGTSAASSAKGRGIYAVELATLSSTGVPSFTSSGSKIWGYTNANNSAMAFSFPSEVAAIDSTGSGFADRLYAADTGGNVWRFDVGNTNTASWTARKLFSSNPGSGGSSDSGRKIFYKPSVVVEPGYTMLYFGTGDREHPLNTNVVDRIYALKDVKDSTQPPTITESAMMDVTSDLLQTTTISSGAGSIKDIMSRLTASTNYGWYIKLDEHPGEKVLSSPLVFSKTVYMTTYAPGAASTDICQTGNLGTSRQYALNYLTGEAVLDYDPSNNSVSSSNVRSRGPGLISGSGSSSTVVQRSDRVKTTGTGIPSGIVLMITSSGVGITTGINGGLAGDKPKGGLMSFPLYWRQR